jgi:hypothetical protein
VDMLPGSVQGLHLVASHINAARAELAGHGVNVGEVQDLGRLVRLLHRSGRERLDPAATAPLAHCETHDSRGDQRRLAHLKHR